MTGVQTCALPISAVVGAAAEPAGSPATDGAPPSVATGSAEPRWDWLMAAAGLLAALALLAVGLRSRPDPGD